MIFDSHAHYNDEAFSDDLEDILAEFPDAGIGSVVNVADTLESIDRVLELSRRYPFFYAALGIHPGECENLTEEALETVRARLHEPKVVAVGEIGLDYHWDTPEREIQQRWFRAQIRLAQDERKPIIIHSRDAAQDTLQIMREMHAERTGGVLHCYSYSLEMAREFIRLGFYIGVGGVVTFRNARKLKEVVEHIPIEKIVLETDCPYMAPTPHRGERNTSLNLPCVVQAIAELKRMDPEGVIRITEDNARQLYYLK
ncbi:TatD DNase family protein [Lachnospiraceae bacterium NK3A20]|nr:TatD DNase family protein [Lachnospiraceae bacterium NK3A20]